jgi:hypothetical protein
MDKSGSFNAQLLLDKQTMKRMKLKLKGGVVKTVGATTLAGGSGKAFFVKFQGAALAALKKELKTKHAVKVSVAVTGTDKTRQSAKKLVKSYTLKSGASA